MANKKSSPGKRRKKWEFSPTHRKNPFRMRIHKYKNNRNWGVIFIDPLTGEQREVSAGSRDEKEVRKFIKKLERTLRISPAEHGPSRLAEPTKRNKEDSTLGVIYFIEAMGLGLVKIGWSTSPAQRMGQINSTSPVPTRVLGMTIGTQVDESELHEHFVVSHHRFEWFFLTADLRDYIERKTALPSPQSEWPKLARKLAKKAQAETLESAVERAKGTKANDIVLK